MCGPNATPRFLIYRILPIGASFAKYATSLRLPVRAGGLRSNSSAWGFGGRQEGLFALPDNELLLVPKKGLSLRITHFSKVPTWQSQVRL